MQDLVKLRREPSFKHGDYFEALKDNAVFSFVREFDGETGYVNGHLKLVFTQRNTDHFLHVRLKPSTKLASVQMKSCINTGFCKYSGNETKVSLRQLVFIEWE